VRAETRRSLKEDRFRGATIEVAEKTAHWTVEHQSKLIVAGIVAAVLLVAGFGSWSYVNHQDEQASVELGQAVRTMETQLRPAGVPAQPGFPSFGSTQERATEAKKQLQAIIDKYPHTHTADVARYFLGIISEQLGDTATAERQLTEVASTRNKDLSSLAKLALASAYREDNKDAQAIDLYKQLVDKPSRSVAKVTAQMELASLYQAKQQTAEAKRIYEQIQKENPASEAASLANQKLLELK
jgi:predicted negative regulator of RcsB-dependent stress response